MGVPDPCRQCLARKCLAGVGQQGGRGPSCRRYGGPFLRQGHPRPCRKNGEDRRGEVMGEGGRRSRGIGEEEEGERGSASGTPPRGRLGVTACRLRGGRAS